MFIILNVLSNTTLKASVILTFRCKQVINKYIYNNKPKFSKQQLVDIIEGNEELSDGEVIEEIYKLINK